MNKDMNNILKQTIAGMRQQPLITALTVIGTALAICLIMIVMMTREVQIADYGAEPYRSRTLYVLQARIKSDGMESINGGITMEAVNAIFMKMKTPESVVTYNQYPCPLETRVPGGDIVSLKVKPTGYGFFSMFSLDFIEGKPFTKEECSSDMPIAIISQSACRKLFGKDRGVKGKSFNIANHEYRVAGVVGDVSQMLFNATADIWVPMSLNPRNHPLYGKLGLDGCSVALLAKSVNDFPKIRQETKRLLAAYNKTTVPDTLDFIGGPYDVEMSRNIYADWSDENTDLADVHLRYMLIFAILLIVPAINIASMTQSQLRRREAEIGVRRAFGAKRSTIMMQTFMESLIQTIAAGLLGLLLCFGACFLLADYIFKTDDWWEPTKGISIDMGILFSPEIYCWAMFFCFILNVLSAIIPAWRASRCNIVEALK